MSEGHAPPLAGIRVLDLSRVLAGPWLTMTLGDLGADVWKIENPRDGDETRGWRPPAYHETSTYFLGVNRNKSSLALDFSTASGQAVLRELAQRADIVVENYLTGALARYGLDYDSLAAINPRLIYCSISGYGRTGALAQRAGYDFLIQGESGLMSITGEPDGSPQKLGVAICDVVAGSNGAQAVLAALYARERTGRGQFIDIALHDSAIAALINVGSGSLNGGGAAQRYGNAHPSIVPYAVFAASDGPFVLACANNRQFRDLCDGALKRPELAQDERFATNALRVANRAVLTALLTEHFATLPVAEIVAACAAVNVPCGPVRTVEEALASSEVAERGMIYEFDDGLRVTASPLRLSDTPVRLPSAPPKLGEHSDAILRDVLGYDAVRIAGLRAAGVIA